MELLLSFRKFEQDSGHDAAMQLVADGFPIALRCAKHLFFSLCDECILEKTLARSLPSLFFIIFFL